MKVYEETRSHGATTHAAEVEYGYLLPHSTTVQGGYPTRLLAAANARLASNSFTLMRTTSSGWRPLHTAAASETTTKRTP